MKIIKPPQISISENPLSQTHRHRLYIHHNKKPFVCAEVIHPNSDEELEFLKRENNIYGTLDFDDEKIIIIANLVCPAEATEESADKLAKVMNRLAKWYKSYLIWEDRSIK
jgi:hypothetical protein